MPSYIKVILFLQPIRTIFILGVLLLALFVFLVEGWKEVENFPFDGLTGMALGDWEED